jgi:hypothetical protein
MKGTDHFKRTIQMYLEQRAAEDALFAKNYRNASNGIPQCGQIHPQRVSARSWSLFHECPHSVQMFVPSALLIA